MDFPDCLAQLRSMRGASEWRSCSCHESGVIPKALANSARSAGTSSRRRRRPRRRRTSSASRAVLMLQFFYLGGQFVGLPDPSLQLYEVLEGPVALDHDRRIVAVEGSRLHV